MLKKKILAVDDEEDFLKIIKLNLEVTGKYEVLTLPTAKDIIAQAKNFKPDVILLDLLMPGIGGIEACKRLKEDLPKKDTPIIILSALDKDEDKLKAYKEGIVDYITKPIEAPELIAKIEKVLEYKQGQ